MYVQLRESLRKGAPVGSPTRSQAAVEAGLFAPWVARRGATMQKVDLRLLAVETATWAAFGKPRFTQKSAL